MITPEDRKDENQKKAIKFIKSYMPDSESRRDAERLRLTDEQIKAAAQLHDLPMFPTSITHGSPIHACLNEIAPIINALGGDTNWCILATMYELTQKEAQLTYNET